MADSSGNGVWFGIGLGLGVVAGGLFMWAVISGREAPAQAALQSMSAPVMQPVLPPALPPINMYPVIREEVKPEIPGMPKVHDQQPAIEPVFTYKNNEKWVIIRDEDGAISSMEIIRDAKVNGT